MRAILSVSDKTGLVDFAQGLHHLGVEIYSTGGTRRALASAGVPVRSVEELTHFPEILDGRVKTLHPGVHAGILAKRNLPSHLEQLDRHQFSTIELVAVNLYPFVQTISKKGVTLDEALENIDIGGPTMIRAAAKSFPYVVVVVDPSDYPLVLEQLQRGEISMEMRQKLAQKAFQHVSAYDAAIAQYLRLEQEKFPQTMTVALKKRLDLRYGENPHQSAAFYEEERWGQALEPGVTTVTQRGGKELSFNNILDADAAWNVVADFAAPTVAIIKHTNPCGLSSHPQLAEAYRRAYTGDPVSAFGGIVALNRRVDLATAQEMEKIFYEIIIAPDFDDDAQALLQRKRDLRLLAVGSSQVEASSRPSWDFRRVRGGFLAQTWDALPQDRVEMRLVTQRETTSQEKTDLLFAWRAVKHVKSNAILLARDLTLLGMGAGQPNRVTSVKIALERAGDRAQGSVLASDAFFPFPDGVELAAKGGVKAIIQPGGSVRDEEAIRVADQYGIAMVFTGERHFRH
ncbi:MAG: bifunctional phosphoribosylaminoimidazolecarboxamide formyltransferase/IMP cyclohydrolase [Chloroflexi bacterium]|nr:bifunctional phosphoribosylaminoimidazolecarboxamide formyltransferase/IMP cyclohydrolase [Chloroflexota bacterium]